MSLYVDQSSGADIPNGTTDLYTISWDDGNLGQGADASLSGSAGGITSIPVTPVTYTPSVTTNKATADRLFTLVNTTTGANWADPIVITPLAGGIDPYSGMDITGNGQTYVDVSATPNVIHVVYDTSQAGGKGIAGYDTSGNLIQTPNAVILYHELSHAYHNALGQIPFPQTACPGNTTDEPAAELDENVMRTELGLCLRDVCNHGGQSTCGLACGGSATPNGAPLTDGSGCGSGGGNGGGGCFIVTAATGSAQSADVTRLRRLREQVARRSDLAKRLIAGIYAEYLEFSPGVAAEISGDPVARAVSRDHVVRPLFAWFTLAERVVLEPSDVEGRRAAAEALHAACDPTLAPLVVRLLKQAEGGEAWSEGTPLKLRDFGASLVHATTLPLARWALLRPLLEAWTLERAGRDAEQAVTGWMSDAPLELLRPPPARLLTIELSRLASLYDFAPEARRAVGGRLLKAWPAASDDLHRHGFS